MARRRKKWATKETDLATPLTAWLRSMHWEVYSEVQIRSYDGRADIVAVFNKKVVWVIEMKLSFSLSLMAQAHGWHNCAHYVSIAIPQLGWTKGSNFGSIVLQKFGIGILEIPEPPVVPENDWKADHYFAKIMAENRKNMTIVDERTRPKFNRQANAEILLNCLAEEHKTWATAGSAEGDFYTPFKGTRKRVQEYVAKNPSCTMKEIVADVDTHYQSVGTAKSCIASYIRSGVIDGIRCDESKRPFRFYPEKDDEQEE